MKKKSPLRINLLCLKPKPKPNLTDGHPGRHGPLPAPKGTGSRGTPSKTHAASFNFMNEFVVASFDCIHMVTCSSYSQVPAVGIDTGPRRPADSTGLVEYYLLAWAFYLFYLFWVALRGLFQWFSGFSGAAGWHGCLPGPRVEATGGSTSEQPVAVESQGMPTSDWTQVQADIAQTLGQIEVLHAFFLTAMRRPVLQRCSHVMSKFHSSLTYHIILEIFRIF